MKAGQPDHYAALGLPRDASIEEVKRAYHQAAQKLHPDVNQAPGETELFLEVQQAFDVLSQPAKRAQYDATLPPIPKKKKEAPQAVLHEVYFSRPNLVQLSEPQMIYMLLEVSPRGSTDQDRAQLPPLNVALVLDRSTSMQGQKLDMVKSAASQLIKGLRRDDILSVIAFSDKADVIVSCYDQGDRAQMEECVHMMQPSGSTEMFKGLEAGLGQVERRREPSRVNHVILLTDGHTYGDEQACLKLADRASANGIGISCMGIGTDWNDIFLDAVASRTGGSSAYISKAGDIGAKLLEKFKALSNTFANETVLEINPQEGIEINYTFRIQPEAGPVEFTDSMKLGPILHDAPLSVLFEFVVQPAALKGNSVALLNGSLKVSLAANSQGSTTIPLKLAREVAPHATSDPPPTRILNALSSLTLYRLQERAHKESDAGNFADASQSLKNLASNLLAQGQHQLARTALLEAENLERMHQWSGEGGKAIKYSTRGLMFSQPKGIKK